MMFSAKNGLVAMTLLACLAAPLMASATSDDHDRDDRGRERRYYDREHRDYHTWDAREDAAYRRWRAERQEKYVEYERLKAKEQERYWHWRHEHPDAR
jgi:hypothetical protein